MGERREVRRRNRSGKALDRVIAGMCFQDQRGLRPDCRGEIGEVGAVGGADLAQAGPSADHDVGQAERAADLDQFAARDDRLAPVGERIQHQHQRAGIVVDGERRLGPGQPPEPARDMVVPLAAPAGFEVVFEGRRVAHRFDRGGDRLLGQRRAAEIGVQNGPGQVEHTALRWPHQTFESLRARFDDLARRGGDAELPLVGQRGPDRLQHQRPAISRDQRANRLGPQHLIDPRQSGTAAAAAPGHQAVTGSGTSSAAPGSRRTRRSGPFERSTRPIIAAR